MAGLFYGLEKGQGLRLQSLCEKRLSGLSVKREFDRSLTA